MPVGWAIAGSAALNYIGSQQGSNAARDTAAANTAAQERMNNQNIQFQRDTQAQNLAYAERWNALNDPFAAQGGRAQFVQPLIDLAKGGTSAIFNDPMYQVMSAQGQEAISRRMSASGQGGSGAEMVALSNYTQGNALQAYQTHLSQLSALAGAGTPGSAYHGQAPQGAILQPQISPTMAYNMAASPFAGGASTLGTLASLYGSNNNQLSNAQVMNMFGSNYTPLAPGA